MRTYKRHYKACFFLHYHVIWCPKYRRGLLIGALKERLEQIIREVAYERRDEIITMEIMPDHVHLLLSTRHDEAPYKAIKAMKGRSSNILRKEFQYLTKMPTLWSRSYFLSSLGAVLSDTAKEYIENQWKK